MMRTLFTLSILFFQIAAWSQSSASLTIQGNVMDTKTGEPLLYVNVGVEGTNIGKATDSNGFFSIDVPIGYVNKNIFVSAVGYDKIFIPINGLKNGDEVNTIRLKPLTYGIESVEVSAKSLVLYRIVSNAANKIEENYFHKPFQTYFFYFSTHHIEGDTITKNREAEIIVADQEGYGNDRYSAFKYRITNILDVDRNFSPGSLEERKTLISDLLEFDIVRYPANILELEYVNDFDLKLISENDLEWEISYKLEKPEVSRTGDFYAQKYSGNITILKNNYEVVKNETTVFAPQQNIAGRSRAISGEILRDVTYSFSVSYAENQGKYFPEAIFLRKNYIKNNRKVEVTAGMRSLKIERGMNAEINKKNEFVDMREPNDSLFEHLILKYPAAVIKP